MSARTSSSRSAPGSPQPSPSASSGGSHCNCSQGERPGNSCEQAPGRSPPLADAAAPAFLAGGRAVSHPLVAGTLLRCRRLEIAGGVTSEHDSRRHREKQQAHHPGSLRSAQTEHVRHSAPRRGTGFRSTAPRKRDTAPFPAPHLGSASTRLRGPRAPADRAADGCRTTAVRRTPVGDTAPFGKPAVTSARRPLPIGKPLLYSPNCASNHWHSKHRVV